MSLNKLERKQRVRGEGRERVAYDSKSVKKFEVVVEKMNRIVFFYIQQKSCTYAVNVLEFDSSLSSGGGSGGSGSSGSGSPIECTTGGGLDYGDD